MRFSNVKSKVYPISPVKQGWWKTQNRKRLLDKLKHFWSTLSFTYTSWTFRFSWLLRPSCFPILMLLKRGSQTTIILHTKYFCQKKWSNLKKQKWWNLLLDDFDNQSTLKIRRKESLHNRPLHILNQLEAFEDKLCNVRNTALRIPHNKLSGPQETDSFYK